MVRIAMKCLPKRCGPGQLGGTQLGGALLGAALLCLPFQPAVAQTGISIVAAENFYGDVARQIAGPDATVSSILSNPDDDPHMFEASPSVARALALARIVVANGAAYDPWIDKLLSAGNAASRTTIIVADLVHSKPGANPHLWYDPPTLPTFAHALSATLSAADPAHAAEYTQRLQAFDASFQPVVAKVAELRTRFAGTSVTATEPVFGYMATALGLVMRNERFQMAVMNGTEPGASDVAAFERDLQQRRVNLLIYNSQASDESARRLLGMARKAGIAVVGVTETEPAGVTVQSWMLDTLAAVGQALSHSGS